MIQNEGIIMEFMSTEQIILEALEKLKLENERLYLINGNTDFEAGRVDGVKQAIETIHKLKKYGEL
jgi:hypothetical protein